VTAFDSRQFRDVLGHVPTSVVVVAGIDSAGAPQGITIGSFVSVSLEPPLVGFLPGTQSKTWNSLKGTGKFCVNVLAENQADVCWRFAKDPVDGATNRFDGLEWQKSANGSPILSGILASIDCIMLG
jgi:flavin reductase (DIM6/NTAB) family NADH-FMN oxidoreductase RutF